MTMQCIQCQQSAASSIEHARAQYAFVLVFGNDNVRDEVQRVLRTDAQNLEMTPGCCMYCRHCKQMCRLATAPEIDKIGTIQALDTQVAAMNASVRQDADRALFACMQQDNVCLY
jgi:late competence protein required for DNA uptake (superfamily II DNA/RNA helicase)